jgi:hypothetical protein
MIIKVIKGDQYGHIKKQIQHIQHKNNYTATIINKNKPSVILLKVIHIWYGPHWMFVVEGANQS